MSNATMLVSVTKQLRNELAATGRVLAELDKAAQSNRKYAINDKTYFVSVVEALESLTIATLAATSSVSLTSMSSIGARFDMGSGNSLSRHVSVTVGYLRDTATELLATGGFSQYEGDNTRVALGYLKELNGLLLCGVVKQAQADLETVRSRGIVPLLVAAETLAKSAASTGNESGEDEDEDEDDEPWDLFAR